MAKSVKICRIIILVLLCMGTEHGGQTQQRGVRPVTIEEAEATAARDLIKQSPPAASANQGRTIVRAPSERFDLLNIQLNAAADDTLKATHQLVQRLDSFLQRF